jgi:hypothetical protein
VIEYAEAHQVTEERIAWAQQHPKFAIGNDSPRLLCELPVGFRVAFSIEHHGRQGPCRHISISVAGKPGKSPNEHAVREIAREFGFNVGPELGEPLKSQAEMFPHCVIYFEEGPHPAVNIVQRLDGGPLQEFKDGE